MNTSGHTVLITGGGSDLGLALADAFLGAGNEVILCGPTQAPLDAALERFPCLHTFTCDVSVASDRKRLFERVCEHVPDLDILVNNAAIAEQTDLREASAAERIAAELDVDLQAPIQLTMQFLPHLLKQPEAAVINITTALAYVPAASYPAYSAATAGLHSFSQSLRHQLAGTAVCVFEVLPPAVDTPLTTEPGPRMAPDDVAAGVLAGLRNDQSEIRIGATRALYAMARLLPRMAFSVLNPPPPAPNPPSS